MDSIITSLKGEVETLIKKYNVGYFCDKNLTWSEQIYKCLNNPEKREIYFPIMQNLYITINLLQI